MSEPLVIESHKGPYRAYFDSTPFAGLQGPQTRRHFLIDSRVAALYPQELKDAIASPSVLLIEANEEAKNLVRFPGYVDQLVERKIRRGDQLVAIGGGVIQDITCFLAATMLRGLDWIFFPTTLLAQADSCIGSKSSINSGSAKNILGTFTPPKEVRIAMGILKSLPEDELRSGIGEMLKIHLIDSLASFRRIAASYSNLLNDEATLSRFVHDSLKIKKRFIEQDEFDRGIRNVLNYGHSFGHAIESATHFKVPHGIAVTIGMDLANYVSHRRGKLPLSLYEEIHSGLKANCAEYINTLVPFEPFLSALSKDKKNTPDRLGLILPNESALPQREEVANDASFQDICRDFFEQRLRK